MTVSVKDIDISSLSLSECVQLAHNLLDFVAVRTEGEPFTAEQLAEIDRRAAEADAGRIASEPWEPFRDSLLSQ